MKTKGIFKKIIAALICVSVAACSICLAQGTAFAAEESTEALSVYEGENLDVPQIRITTESGNGTALQKDDGYVNASISIMDTDGSVLSDSVQLKVRGNTTALSWVTKKAYNFKFEKKKDVLGMGKGKKWSLLANAFDPTLLRNYTAFDLADELGLEFTSQQKICELWLDGSFRGCYTLYEPVQEGKERVNIDIESNEGKKDFMLELEMVTVEDDKTYLTVDNDKIRFAFSEPEEPDDEQQAYVQGIMDDITATLKTGVREDIEQKVDIESFAKFYLLNEYLKTYDFERTSVYFYYKDGKLYAGPAWDYDASTGNERPEYGTRAKNAQDPTGLFAKKNLFRYLCNNAWFYNEVSDVYKEHYEYFENICADNGYLDTTLATYKDVFDRNYKEAGWNISKWWINFIRKPDSTYQANYDYLKSWCAERNEWLTGELKPFGETFVKGDADNDDCVTVTDVTILQRIAAGLETYDSAVVKRGNITGSGIDANDALEIQKYIAKFKNDKNIGYKQRY